MLDLTNEFGELAGGTLADLGADVIKSEPPEGDPSRLRPSVYGERPDPEASQPWNLNNCSISLDLQTRHGQSQFRGLVDTADFRLLWRNRGSRLISI